METKVNGLEAKNMELETKVNNLVGKNVELEGKNVELETKVNNLVGKNVKLEGKVKQLEGKVWKLETQPNPSSTVQKSVHRSCHEMFAADVFLISGFYWIDPDGHGAGDDPINVYCEKNTGK